MKAKGNEGHFKKVIGIKEREEKKKEKKEKKGKKRDQG